MAVRGCIHPSSYPPGSAFGYKLQKPSKESGIIQSLGTSVLSKLCACARAHSFQRLRTRVNILRTDTQYHDEAMFSVGKLRKIAPEPVKRTHFFAKCTVQWLRVTGARGGGAPQIFYSVLLLFTFYNLKN